MNDRALNNNPTFIFKTSLTTLEIAFQLNREPNHFLSSCYVYFDANEKRTKNMTVFTLSVYHPLLQKKIPLATMDCEKEYRINAKIFFATWNEALSEFQEGLTFDPTGVILNERDSNWNAIKEIYGEEFLNCRQSCEFHLKQSVNRRLKSSGLFAGERARDKMRFLSRKLLESKTTIQFEKACEEAVKFIEEKEKRNPLKAWLSRKEHIFHAFTRKFSPQSNLALVIHSSSVTQKRTHLSAYKPVADDICEMITVKQMLVGYADGSFRGGTGPSFNTLQIRRKARETSTYSMIFEGESDCSPPRKRKKFTKNKCTKENRVTSNKKVSTNKWQISDGSDQSERCDSNEETPNLSTIRLGNKRGRRSADFLTSLKNVKNDKDKMTFLDFGESNKFSCRYDVLSSTGKRGKSYRMHLKQDISCFCEVFAQKNTPCKHLLYVYLFVLNLPKDLAVLQQVHLSGSELIEMFSK